MHQTLNLWFRFHYKGEASKLSVVQGALCPLKEIVKIVLLSSMGQYLCMCTGVHSIHSFLAHLRAVTDS